MADNFAQTLTKIKEQMATRREERIKAKGAESMSKLGTTMDQLGKKMDTANQAAARVKYPTAKDFAEALIKSAPIFGAGFTQYIAKSLDNDGKVIDTLSQINENGKAAGSDDDKHLELEYLDLIHDTTGSVLKAVEVGFTAANKNIITNGKFGLMAVKSLWKLESKMGKMGESGDDSAVINQLVRIDGTIRKVGGHLMGELVRTRQDNKAREERSELARLEAAKDGNTGHPKATSEIPISEDDQDGDGRPDPRNGAGGGLADIGGAIAILGLFKNFFTKGIGGLFKGMKNIVPMLGKAGKLLRVGPLALLSAVIDFGKGAWNAKEILHKDDVTITDRIGAGLSEVAGGFGDMVDWISGIFGDNSNTAGPQFRKWALELLDAPMRWANNAVDWVKNDLFAGISENTSLTEVPGMLADNLQKQLKRLVDWVGDTMSGWFDSVMKADKELGDESAKWWDEHVSKPVKELLNSIVDGILNNIQKVIDLIPSALGGDALRAKMTSMRAEMGGGAIPFDPTMGGGGAGSGGGSGKPAPTMDPNGRGDVPVQQPKATPEAKDTPAPVPPTVVVNTPSPELRPVTTINETVIKPVATVTASPMSGRTAANTDQIAQDMQKAKQAAHPISQTNISAPKTVNQNTTVQAQSLEPTNRADNQDSLWNY